MLPSGLVCPVVFAMVPPPAVTVNVACSLGTTWPDASCGVMTIGVEIVVPASAVNPLVGWTTSVDRPPTPGPDESPQAAAPIDRSATVTRAMDRGVLILDASKI